MKLTSNVLASGPGWQVTDVVCTAGPNDRPFEEQHGSVCIAAVSEGTFQYRTKNGTAVLAPGALVLGDAGNWFECDHEHGVGDRCLALHLTPAYWEEIVASVPDARRTDFVVSHLPPRLQLVPLLAAAEAARDGDAAEFEELVLRLAGTVVMALAGSEGTGRRPSKRDERRVTGVLRRIEDSSHESLPLADLARDAAMSPYHFLRTFMQVVGMTPHQFALRTRLHRAAVRLRRSDEPVSAIAFEVGFNDLSTFNRRFRRVMGTSPSGWRARPATQGQKAIVHVG